MTPGSEPCFVPGGWLVPCSNRSGALLGAPSAMNVFGPVWLAHGVAPHGDTAPLPLAAEPCEPDTPKPAPVAPLPWLEPPLACCPMSVSFPPQPTNASEPLSSSEPASSQECFG